MIQVLTHCINTCAVAGGMRGWLGGGSHKHTLPACSHHACALEGRALSGRPEPSLDAQTSPAGVERAVRPMSPTSFASGLAC